MARDTNKLVTIPGELHSAATGGIVAAAEEIFDYDANITLYTMFLLIAIKEHGMLMT
jgi:hypothetical protein